MANKKGAKLAVLSLLALLGITACSSSDVKAKPSDYDNQILVTDEDIYNNTKSTIYDAIRDGSLASDVLDKVLYQYAISTLGRYNTVIPELATSSQEEGINITLKAAAADALSNSGYATVRKFIKAHKAYWSVDDEGEHVDDNGNKVTGDTYDDDREIQRVISKWNTIELRIKEAMYKAIKGSEFAYRNKFEEKKYLVSLRKNLKAVEDYNTLVEEDDFSKKGLASPRILDPKYDEEDVFDQFLHRANYQSNYALGQQESADDAATYVEDELIPTIYRTLLTEQYLFDKTYNTLGRSYARKINVVAINENSEYPKAAEYLMREFVTKVVSAAPSADTAITKVSDSTNKIEEKHFNMISNIWKGVDLDTYAAGSQEATIRDALVAKNAIVEEAYDDNGTARKFYKGTEFGEMMEDYSKINDDPLLTNSSIESTFTSSGSYTKEIGKEIKTDEIRLKNHVTKGWYVKNGNLSLASSIISRLFSVGVANGLDTDDSADRYYYDSAAGEWKYHTDAKENKYVARINGSYFLKVESTEAHDTTDPEASASDILFKSDSTWYVVQILEAANSTKLSKNNNNNYAHIKGEATMEDYVNEIAKTLSSNSTYENLAKKHWVSEMAIKYHDTVVYDYFKTNFPELF